MTDLPQFAAKRLPRRPRSGRGFKKVKAPPPPRGRRDLGHDETTAQPGPHRLVRLLGPAVGSGMLSEPATPPFGTTLLHLPHQVLAAVSAGQRSWDGSHRAKFFRGGGP